MNRKIYNILNKIESLGYEAYIVGGYVRDFVLNKKSYDIDISTNATIETLNNIFSKSKIYESYGCIKFTKGKYNISITSYRKELDYKNNKPININYLASLEEDALRRDFTINAIYMDKKGKIIDPLNGLNEIKNKEIKVIGDISIRLTEDSTRILRALRFMSILNFNLENSLLKFIINNKELIKKINYPKKKEEIDRIFKEKGYLIFLDFINKNDLLDSFGIIYENINECSNYLGIWAQIHFSKNYNFSKEEINIISSLKKIIKNNIISNMDLFNYGLEISLIASEILKIDAKEIKLRYKKLSIKSESEIKIKFNEIQNILNNKNYNEINKINNKIKEDIVEGKLKNKYNDIKEYLIKGGFNG